MDERERARMLARVAQAHDAWVVEHLDDVPFDPDAHPETDDYNVWYVDMDADPEAQAEFMRVTNAIVPEEDKS